MKEEDINRMIAGMSDRGLMDKLSEMNTPQSETEQRIITRIGEIYREIGSNSAIDMCIKATGPWTTLDRNNPLQEVVGAFNPKKHMKIECKGRLAQTAYLTLPPSDADVNLVAQQVVQEIETKVKAVKEKSGLSHVGLVMFMFKMSGHMPIPDGADEDEYDKEYGVMLRYNLFKLQAPQG